MLYLFEQLYLFGYINMLSSLKEKHVNKASLRFLRSSTMSKYIEPEERDDKAKVLICCEKNGYALNWASPELKVRFIFNLKKKKKLITFDDCIVIYFFYIYIYKYK